MINFWWRLVVGVVLLITSLFVLAQNESGNTVPGGIVNGKARHLAVPQYPAVARAVKAAGQVQVQVTIDENGDVISAAAISGHPLLRAAAVGAARQSKFATTILSGQPVKVTGVIVYNFNSELNLIQLGFALAHADTAQIFDGTFNSTSIIYSLPGEWINERKQAQLIADKQLRDTMRTPVKTSPKFEPSPKSSSDTVPFQAAEGNRQGVSIIADSEHTAGPERVEVKESYSVLIGSLISSIRSRLANDEAESWQFSLGLALGKMQAQIESDANLQKNIAELKLLTASAPENYKPIFITGLQQISAFGDDGVIDAAEKNKIKAFALKMR